MLDTRDIWLLEIFVSVVNNGSMAGAARERHLTTPTVSEAIAKLERLAGSQLLVRTASGCYPTPDGRRIETSARELLDASASYLHAINSPAKTAYRVGSTFGAHSSFVADLDLRHDGPGMSPVSLGLENPGQQLIDGFADVALLMGPTQHDHLFHREPILVEPRYAMVGHEVVPPGATALSLELLDDLEWPSVPSTADQVFLGPWICNDVRPGPPKRQGPVLTEIFALRDWMMTNRNDVVVATTAAMAEVFGGFEGMAILPIDVKPWNVDLVGLVEMSDRVKDIARFMRTANPSAESA